MNTENIENEIRQLSEKSGEMIWKGQYWGEGEVLDLAPKIEILRRLAGRMPEAVISSASTYYSAAGHANSQATATSNPFKFIVWKLRAIVTYFKAFKKAQQFLVASELAKTVPSDYDVVGSIYSLLPFRYFKRQAIDCFAIGLDKHLKKDRDERNGGLLLIKIGRTHAMLGNTKQARNFVERAIATVTSTTDPKDSNRIYRDAGDFFWSMGGKETWRGSSYLYEAREIAFKAGLIDSVLKIDGVMSKYIKDK